MSCIDEKEVPAQTGESAQNIEPEQTQPPEEKRKFRDISVIERGFVWLPECVHCAECRYKRPEGEDRACKDECLACEDKRLSCRDWCSNNVHIFLMRPITEYLVAKYGMEGDEDTEGYPPEEGMENVTFAEYMELPVRDYEEPPAKRESETKE